MCLNSLFGHWFQSLSKILSLKRKCRLDGITLLFALQLETWLPVFYKPSHPSKIFYKVNDNMLQKVVTSRKLGQPPR